MRRDVLFLMLLVVSFSAYAQPNVLWKRAYGGTHYESWSILVDLPGGNIITGTNSLSSDRYVHGAHGNNDVWLTKLSPSGDTIWTRAYGGNSNDYAYDGILTSSGTVLIASSTYTNNNGDVGPVKGNSDVWMLEVDTTDGSIIFSKTYGGTGHEFPYVVIENSKQQYVVAIHSNNASGDIDSIYGNTDALLLVLDKSGNLIKQAHYGGTQVDQFEGLIETADNSYVMVGHASSNDYDVTGQNGNHDLWIVKVDTGLQKKWVKVMGGTEYEGAVAVDEAPDGSLYVWAYQESTDGDLANVPNADSTGSNWLVKLSAAGDIIWQKVYGGSGYEYAGDIVVRGINDIILLGETTSTDGDLTGETNRGSADLWILSVDSAGNINWSETMGGSKYDGPSKLMVDEKGDIYAGALTSSSDVDVDSVNGLQDLWVIKFCGLADTTYVNNMPSFTANHGFTGVTYQWIDCSGNSVASTNKSFTATKNGNYKLVVTTGCTTDTTSCFAVTGIGIADISKQEMAIYPNPNNGIYVIQVQGNVAGELFVRDMLGKVVQHQQVSNSKSNYAFSMQVASAGMYIVELKTEEGSYVQKMIIRK